MIPFSWSNPYAWPRKPLLAQNVVATSQPLAAQAGLQMLAGGGNAVVSWEPFIDIVGRHFKQPAEGLGFDNSSTAHMWRTIRRPTKYL